MSAELPQGWVTARVREIIESIQPGFASGRKNVAGGVAHLRMNNVGVSGELVLDLVRAVPDKLAKPRHYLRHGDVLVCTTNSAKLVGKCAYFDLKGRYAFSNHLTRLRPKPETVDGRFLRWSLWLDWQHGTFADKCKHWVNQSTLPKEALLETTVLLPPWAEQLRIVEKLETLIGKVDACQQRLAKIPALLRRYRQSVLTTACSGRLTADWREDNRVTIEADWRDAELREFIESSFYGPRFSKGSYSMKGIPTIRTTDMSFDGSIVLRDCPCISLSKAQLSKFGLQDGDLVVTRTGATIGKCAVYEESLGPAIPGAYLIRFRFKRDVLVPRFILRFFMSPRGQQLLIGGSNAVAQPNVNATTISQFVIPVPPVAEQWEIVRRVEALLALADQIEGRFRAAQAHVDKLTSSLLAKAFRGELATQDPYHEPAEQLLQRTRDVKAFSAVARRTGKKGARKR